MCIYSFVTTKAIKLEHWVNLWSTSSYVILSYNVSFLRKVAQHAKAWHVFLRVRLYCDTEAMRWRSVDEELKGAHSELMHPQDAYSHWFFQEIPEFASDCIKANEPNRPSYFHRRVLSSRLVYAWECNNFNRCLLEMTQNGHIFFAHTPLETALRIGGGGYPTCIPPWV